MMFKIGDKVQIDPSHIITQAALFSHNTPYEIEAILSGSILSGSILSGSTSGINYLVLKGILGYYGAHYFVMYKKHSSVGFTIE
jgi:hypothetical protein